MPARTCAIHDALPTGLSSRCTGAARTVCGAEASAERSPALAATARVLLCARSDRVLGLVRRRDTHGLTLTAVGSNRSPPAEGRFPILVPTGSEAAPDYSRHGGRRAPYASVGAAAPPGSCQPARLSRRFFGECRSGDGGLARFVSLPCDFSRRDVSVVLGGSLTWCDFPAAVFLIATCAALA